MTRPSNSHFKVELLPGSWLHMKNVKNIMRRQQFSKSNMQCTIKSFFNENSRFSTKMAILAKYYRFSLKGRQSSTNLHFCVVEFVILSSRAAVNDNSRKIYKVPTKMYSKMYYNSVICHPVVLTTTLLYVSRTRLHETGQKACALWKSDKSGLIWSNTPGKPGYSFTIWYLNIIFC